MYRSFDSYGNFETPELILCQPTGKEIQTMSHAMNIKITPRFSSYYTLEFDVPKSFIKDGEIYNVPYYDLIVKDRQVKVENYGAFTISVSEIDHENNREIKHVTCSSIETIIAKTDLISFKGVYKLYDPSDMDKTIMGLFNSVFENEWTIICTDSELWETKRDYDVSETNWYEFLTQSVSEDFQCVFEFDTLTKTITIRSLLNAIHKTDIIISDESLLKKITITPVVDDIKTKLSIYGTDGISIMEVNPLGTNEVYNLDYYCDPSLMMLSDETIDAYKKWKQLYEKESTNYGKLIMEYKGKQNDLLSLNTELTELKHQLDTLESILSTKLNGEDTSTITAQINEKNNQIKAKESQVKIKESEIEEVKKQKTSINTKTNFRNAFTSEQWKEVHAIIRNTSGTYINDAFIKTDSMSDVDVLNKCESLFNLGKEVLKDKSKPKYNFSCDLINFLTHPKFDIFSSQLRPGCEVTIIVDDKEYHPILLEYPLDFNNISKSQIKFSDSLRPSGEDFKIADLLSGVSNSVTSNTIHQGTWSDYYNSGDKDRVNNLYYGAMDLANKKVISTTGQAPLIDHTGIRARKLLDDGTFSPKQIWETNNGIYMTDSNWTKPAKVAIGEIEFDGATLYGIAGDLIVGNLMMTERLVVSNKSNTVRIDSDGFTATNANIVLTRSDNRGGVSLNPYEGITVTSTINNKLEKVFYADESGNLNFKGNLTGATGTFSGNIKGASFVGGSIDIGSGKFKVDVNGNCTARSISITGGDFYSGRIEGSEISGTYIDGGTITGASFRGGSIDIDTNARVGSILYLGGNSIKCGIQFGNGVRLEGNFDGCHIYGGLSTDKDIIAMGGLYDGFDRVATRKYVDEHSGGGIWG